VREEDDIIARDVGIGAAVYQCFDQIIFSRGVDTLRRAARVGVPDPRPMLDEMGYLPRHRPDGVSEIDVHRMVAAAPQRIQIEYLRKMREHVASQSPAPQSRWDLVNAVTSVARALPDWRDRLDLEDAAGRLARLRPPVPSRTPGNAVALVDSWRRTAPPLRSSRGGVGRRRHCRWAMPSLFCFAVRGLRSTHVEVYLFRCRARRAELLVLRRAPHRRVLPGVWQPVTGKRNRGERSLTAAIREVHEETGMVPTRWWALKHVTVYYDAALDTLVALPVFVAEVDADAPVRLSEEHDAWRFVTLEVAGRRVLWESQRRALTALRDEVLRDATRASHIEWTTEARRVSRRLNLRPARRRRSRSAPRKRRS
jgi:dATP pyrophosphohydrolase